MGKRTPAADVLIQVIARKGTTQPKTQPNKPSQNREQSDDRDKMPSQDICKPFDRGAFVLAISYKPNDVVEPDGLACLDDTLQN